MQANLGEIRRQEHIRFIKPFRMCETFGRKSRTDGKT